jgi:hypothetical protein
VLEIIEEKTKFKFMGKVIDTFFGTAESASILGSQNLRPLVLLTGVA